MSTIWRYMDLSKFRSILGKDALYFSTIASQTDKLEGMYPLLAKIARAQDISSRPDIDVSAALHNQEVMDELSKHEVAVSCWHMNDHENPRMWKAYLNKPEGVAIQSSYAALLKSLEAFSHFDYKLINVSEVRYVDRTKDRTSLPRCIDVYFQKRQEYSWEQELRCAIDLAINPPEYYQGRKLNTECLLLDEYPYVRGVFVPVHVDMLIERIVLSPRASDAFFEEVTVLCTRYGLAHKPIERSTAS